MIFKVSKWIFLLVDPFTDGTHSRKPKTLVSTLPYVHCVTLSSSHPMIGNHSNESKRWQLGISPTSAWTPSEAGACVFRVFARYFSYKQSHEVFPSLLNIVIYNVHSFCASFKLESSIDSTNARTASRVCGATVHCKRGRIRINSSDIERGVD